MRARPSIINMWRMLQCSTIGLYRHSKLSDVSGSSLHHGICNMSCHPPPKKEQSAKSAKVPSAKYFSNQSKLLILLLFTMFWHFGTFGTLCKTCACPATPFPMPSGSTFSGCHSLQYGQTEQIQHELDNKSPDYSAVANWENLLTPNPRNKKKIEPCRGLTCKALVCALQDGLEPTTP